MKYKLIAIILTLLTAVAGYLLTINKFCLDENTAFQKVEGIWYGTTCVFGCENGGCKPNPIRGIFIYLETCPYCIRAKEIIEQKNLTYLQIDILSEKGQEYKNKYNISGVPAFIENGQLCIGINCIK